MDSTITFCISKRRASSKFFPASMLPHYSRRSCASILFCANVLVPKTSPDLSWFLAFYHRLLLLRFAKQYHQLCWVSLTNRTNSASSGESLALRVSKLVLPRAACVSPWDASQRVLASERK